MPISKARAKTGLAVAVMTVAPEALVLNVPVARARVAATVAAPDQIVPQDPAVIADADLAPVVIAAVDRSGAMTVATTIALLAKPRARRPRR